jgi:hypothetical protein
MTNQLKIIGLAALIFAAAVVTSCKKDDEGAPALKGKWTSVSATGRVECGFSTLGEDVANTINKNIAAYDLSGVMNFEFEKDGMAAYSEHSGTFYHNVFKWCELKDNILTITQETGFFEQFEISLNGDEFSMKSIKNEYSEIEIIIGLALCEMEVRNRGYSSMQEAGLTLSGFNLTVKYQKQ